MADKWTPEQLDAITQRDCDLLVAAAAGAGKTAVLVERIIRKITDKDRPVDIDRLLVVTFTNAAATEMRERIGEALANALDADPSSANLQKQMALLDRASIMTLHSFCLEVVKGHFHSLDLDPLFRIADETESTLIRLDALEELFEEKYENEDAGSMFYRLLDAYGGGRDDGGLRELVSTLHRFTRSHPWPEQWLAAQAEAYGPGASACLSSTPWARVLLKSAAAELQGLSGLLHKAAALASRAQGLEPYCSVLEEDIGQLEQLRLVCEANNVPNATAAHSAHNVPNASAANGVSGVDWDAVNAAFSSYEPARLPRCGKDADKTAQEEVKALRSLVKDRVKKLYESGFNTTSADLEEDFVKLYPQLKYLTEMVNEFEASYAQKKKLKNLLDFNDLEHFCLKALIEEGVPTAAAKELRERYEEILVDEYQDSNLIQELILTTVAGKEDSHRSVFMVGDVKQSIYRFRQARPELFLSKYESYPREPGYGSRTIQLYKNFRSRPEVINGVNFVFRQIMSAMVGELDYTESEYLNPGAVYEEPTESCITGGPIELHILDVTSSENEIGGNAGETASVTAGATCSIGITTGETASATAAEATSATATAEMQSGGANPVDTRYGVTNSGTASSDSTDTGVIGGPKLAKAASDGEIGKNDGENQDEDEEESFDNIQAEARVVGNRIRKLVTSSSEGFNVYDKKLKTYRPAEFRDIVILMRATRNWADIFTDELAALGIPAYADAGLGYFQTVEVETVLSLLQIIDNPLQDIPMLAVLRSPIAGFDTNELADIRLADRSVPFYEAMKLFADAGQAGDGKSPGQGQEPPAENRQSCSMVSDQNDEMRSALIKKTASFLSRLESWRDASQYTPTDELVWKLMTETGYYSYAGILPGGTERQANLRMLFERARQYEETSYKGLFNFINFIGKLRSGGGDMGSAKILGENDNVVRIMSIHKSKGLEFPIVIVAGCGKRFNMMDLNDGILLHQELGFGPDLVDTDRRTIMPTLPKFAIRQKLRLETLSEEMRILYVAFTRAREKLIIMGSVRDICKTCAKWCASASATEEKLPSFDMMQASNYLDWIGPALVRHESAGLLTKVALQDGKLPILTDEASNWEIKLWGAGAAMIGKEAAQARDNVRKWLDGVLTTETGAGGGNAGPGHAPAEKPGQGSDLIENAGRCGVLEDKHRWDSAASEQEMTSGTGFSANDLISALEWQYPFARLSSIPVKISVTELKRRFYQEEDSETAAAFTRQLVAKPLFMETEKGISAARKGTVMHFVMQHLDLQKLSAALNADGPGNQHASGNPGKHDNPGNQYASGNPGNSGNTVNTVNTVNASNKDNAGNTNSVFIDEIKAQLDKMAAKELLTAEEVSIVKPGAIASFFCTSVGMRMLSTGSIHRETAFNIAIGCTEAYKDLPEEITGGETMLLQGIIDCWFETGDGILLLDYKTDFVPEGGSDIIKERYKIQIDYYTMALERVTGKKVTEKYLYLFYTGELVSV